jgi:uncharacterized cupin superfamily protein
MKRVLPKASTRSKPPPRAKASNYPEPFASRMKGREKLLGELFGLQEFRRQLTRLAPGGVSALRHAHTTPSRIPTTCRQ